MATITPSTGSIGDVITATWTGITTSTDTPSALNTSRGKGATRASVTFGGTFGGATAVLQGSNDNSTWATLTDLAGNAISATAAKIQEFSSSAVYFKPSVTGGTGDNVDVVIAFR